MVHVPSTLDVTGQWQILIFHYQTYGYVSPVQAMYEASSFIKNLIEKSGALFINSYFI